MVKILMCNGECGMEWWTKLNVNKRLILDVFVITGFVALTGNSWHLSMAATVSVLSTLFVFCAIVARTKSTTLIASRINYYPFSISNFR